ncbi:MAG: MATE family efflux transporter [Clostridiales bacterium]|nr:MATE family efflux transporter [Clostridiales bacterium]
MLVQALYNVVDSVFVSWLSEDALTAVGLVFPMQNLMFSISLGTGVGINALLSKSLGERKFKDSDAAANNGLLLMLLSSLIFVFVGIFAAVPFVNSQTPYPSVAGQAVDYLRIVCFFSFASYFQVTFERILQSTGKSVQSMISQLTGAIINIILDPIMIFGLFGFPALGVKGAAIATVTGQFCAACVGLFLNIRYNPDIKLDIKSVFRPRADIIGKIYLVGIPSILMMSIGSVMTYSMNIITGKFSSTAQAVFTSYFRLQSFIFMPVFGLNNGLIPVMAYNFGARSKKRIMEALFFAVKLAIVMMCVGTLIFEVAPAFLLGFFKPSDYMLQIGVPAMRIIAVHFPLAAIGIVLGSVFQAFSQSIYSLIVSLARQLVVLIPVAWLLSLTGVLNNVWWCFLCAEVISASLTIIFYRHVKHKLIDTLKPLETASEA